MKIKKIEQIGDVYHVTFEPTFIKKMIGATTTVERFKRIKEKYMLTSNPAWIKSDGSLIEATDPITEELNKFTRRFDYEPITNEHTLPTKEQSVMVGFKKATVEGYKCRRVCNTTDSDTYYSGWMDCYDWITKNNS